jgi:hypothetical protein
MPSTAEERPMIRYEWSECGVTPLNYNLDGDPTTALFSIDVRGRVDASGARRANPDCEILVEFVLSSDDGEAYPSFLAAGELRDVIEQIENDQGISLDAPDCLKLIRRAITAGNVAVVDDPPTGYQLKMSAVDDGGTAVEIRLPPPPARSLFQADYRQQINASLHAWSAEDLEEGDEHFNSDLIEKLYVKLQRKMNARIAKADAAVAKMRRGAAALREAVRVYDASFDASVAPNQPKSSLRRQGSGLAGISPVKAAPPPSGRRWRTEAIATAEEMEGAVLDAERYAGGEAPPGTDEGTEGKNGEKNFAPAAPDEGTHVAKKTKRGLQLAADVNTN